MKDFTQKQPIFREYSLVLAIFLILYGFTCAPGILWQDSGLYQYRIWNNDIVGRIGLALAHPLYHLIGIATKAIPFGEYAHKINLISAVFGAVAVANLYLLLRLWLKTAVAAVIGTMALGLSWTFWQHCCIAEDYTLYSATFMTELIFLYLYISTRKTCYVYWLALMNGISLSNHMFASIPLFCYFCYLIFLLIKKELSWRIVPGAVLLWAAGAGIYLYLIVNRYLTTGDLGATLMSAAFGDSWGGAVLNNHITPKLVIENFLFLGLCFCSPALILLLTGFWGLLRHWRESRWHLLIVLLAVLFYGFAFRYTVPDRYAFFIPFYCVAGVVIGYGAKQFLARFNRPAVKWVLVLLCLMPVGVYAAVPPIAKAYNIKLGTRRSIPFRNEYTHFLRPWQTGYDGPLQYGKTVMGLVEDNAVILADSTPVYTLWYVQTVLGEKPGVTLYSSHVFNENSPLEDPAILADLISRRPVYVLYKQWGSLPRFLLDHYELKEHGIIWKIEKKHEVGID